MPVSCPNSVAGAALIIVGFLGGMGKMMKGMLGAVARVRGKGGF